MSANPAQELTTKFGALQTTLSNLVSTRQQLDSQLSENQQVKEEFARLKDGENGDVIYKLMGCVLMKQENKEAKSNVDKRIEFIQAEIKRVEDQLKTTSEETEKIRSQIIRIQQQQQQQQQQQGQEQ